MADEDLDVEEGEKSGGKKKLIVIILAVVLLLGGGAGAYFFLMGGDADSEEVVEQIEESVESSGTANYVAMPRPFVFNVMDGSRDRLVQIKVQLMVRGDRNETLAGTHVPLLEGTLVRVFGGATADQLRTPEGKDQLRETALEELNEATMELEGKEIIDSVLFTGFVLQ